MILKRFSGIRGWDQNKQRKIHKWRRILTEHHTNCFLNGGKMCKKHHNDNFQIFIFWILEWSNHLNSKLKMFRITSNFIIIYTKLSKINSILANIRTLDILFSLNHNIHKSSCGLCFWASDLLMDRSY